MVTSVPPYVRICQQPRQSFVDVSVSCHSLVCKNFGRTATSMECQIFTDVYIHLPSSRINVLRRMNVETLFDSSISPTDSPSLLPQAKHIIFVAQKIRLTRDGYILHKYVYNVIYLSTIPSRTEVKKRKIRNNI